MSVVSFRHSDAGTDEAVWRDHAGTAQLVHFADLGDLRRVVVVAPHPDDESLGAGGVVASWSAAGVEVTVVSCSDGDAAGDPGDPAARRELGRTRAGELDEALHALSSGTPVRSVRLGLPDGALADRAGELRDRLRELLADVDLVVAPWPGDGHPDHAAVGAAVREVAGTTPRLEYPVWAWHWGAPADLADGTLVRIPLSPSARRAKSAAIAAHRSQSEGSDPILTPAVLAHFTRDDELFLVDDATLHSLRSVPRGSSEFFDSLYRSSPSGDPWDFDRSRAEQRRQREVLDVLGVATFERGLEIGCATGQLTRRLAARVRELVALDTSARAIEVARRTCARSSGVELRVAHAPDDLTGADRGFDLLVVSDVGYYFSEDALGALLEDLVDRSVPGATLLAAHWTGDSPDHVLDAATVHRVIAATLDRDWEHTSSRRLREHQVDVWSRA